MFNFRHPKPVVDGRAVAVQVVQQKAMRPATTVLVAEATPAAQAATPPEERAAAQDQ
ncbi:hypothetical protein [Massilia haematophila]|uniref:Uncharacterized protein n=1 Tax=Massilia haematophila TaxID=457923 RepID=A0ABV7PHP6_9BURK